MNFFQELFTAGYNLRSKIARAEKRWMIHTVEMADLTHRFN